MRVLRYSESGDLVCHEPLFANMDYSCTVIMFQVIEQQWASFVKNGLRFLCKNAKCRLLYDHLQRYSPIALQWSIWSHSNFSASAPVEAVIYLQQ